MAFGQEQYSQRLKEYQQKADDYSTYKESGRVTDLRNQLDQHDRNKVADWTGGQYGNQLKDTMNRINNREKFNYDLNGDLLYQQYKNQYMKQGKLAMADTVGQVEANTGGYGNSYAVTAGNQAYQGYLNQLNDKVPELYQLAYDRYRQEGQDLYNMYNMYGDAYNREYGEHRDQVGDWKDQYDRYMQQYYNEANMDWSKFAANRDYATGMYQSERDWEYQQYQQQLQEAAAAAAAASYGGGGGYYGGGRSRSGGSDTSSSTDYGNYVSPYDLHEGTQKWREDYQLNPTGLAAYASAQARQKAAQAAANYAAQQMANNVKNDNYYNKKAKAADRIR